MKKKKNIKLEVKNLKKKKLTLKDYQVFLKEFNEFKEQCNNKHKYIQNNRFYLAIVDNSISIEIEMKEVNIFVLLGYFNDLGDCQKAREKFSKIILELNECGFWD